ncbi:MAG: hypothetical protein H6730_05940 [Deltaproteobacteria bacterium]|nr:hypothetical protein [Deltaproteobacteria bacterium]
MPLGGSSEVICKATCALEDVAPPAAPTEPCPSTWTPGADGFCRPPAPPMAPCDEGQRFDRVAKACLPIVACPSAPFFTPEDARAPVYVQAGAVGGDGTEAAPYGRLEDAWAAGGDVVLGEGAYTLDPALPMYSVGRRVVGLCPERTTLVIEQPWGVSQGSLRLSRLRLEVPNRLENGLWTSVDTALDMVEVSALEGNALAVAGSTLTVSRSVIRTSGIRDIVAVATIGGTIRITESTVDAHQVVAAFEDSRISVQDSLLFGRAGVALHLIACQLCDDVELLRTDIRGSPGNGLNVVGPPSVRIEDVGIYDVRGDGVKVSACQLEFHCTGGCPEHCGPTEVPYTELVTRRLYVEGTETGSGVAGDGIRLVMEDVGFTRMNIRGIDASSPPMHRTVLDLERGWVTQAPGGALRLGGNNGPVEGRIRDLTVEGTEVVRFDDSAVISLEKADTTLERVVLRGAAFRGIHAYCGSAHLRDLDVRDTGGDAVSLVEVRPATVERLAASGRGRVRALRRRDGAGAPAGGLWPDRGGGGGERRRGGDRDLRSRLGRLRGGGRRRAPRGALPGAGGQVGLHIEPVTDARFRSGAVSGSEVGLTIGAGRPLNLSLEDVSITEVTTPITRE